MPFDRLKAKGKAIVLCHHLRNRKARTQELRNSGAQDLDQFADTILILKRKRTATSDQTTLHYTLRNAPEQMCSTCRYRGDRATTRAERIGKYPMPMW